MKFAKTGNNKEIALVKDGNGVMACTPDEAI